MKKGRLQSIYPDVEDSRVAGILQKIVLIICSAYLVVVAMGMMIGEKLLSLIAVVAILLLLVPWVLLMRGRLRASGNSLVITIVLIITVFATFGQGYHDIVILAFPIIIVIASLLITRRDFLWVSFLTICAFGWLVFGETYGLFIPKLNTTPPMVDFIITSAILLVAIFGVDLLAENMRRKTIVANQEIASRKSIESELRHKNIHDQLTGIYNRAYFEEELVRREQMQEYPVGIIVADVDGLKRINDSQGHARGDELLRTTALVLSSVFRSEDVLARTGGDEFVILLSHAGSETVKQVVIRIRSTLLVHNSAHPDLLIQLSIGSATARQGKLMEAYIRADKRMYADKEMSRKGV